MASGGSQIRRQQKILLYCTPFLPLSFSFCIAGRSLHMLAGKHGGYGIPWFVHTARKIPFMYSFSGNCAGLSRNFIIRVSVSNLLYIFPGPHISCSRIGRFMVGIYKSLTDTRMWKLGLWPRKYFSGNICFEFSVLVLCSAVCPPAPW